MRCNPSMLLGVTLSALGVACSSTVGGAAGAPPDAALRDVAPDPLAGDVAAPLVSSITLPLRVHAMQYAPDGALVLGGSWDGAEPFAGRPPRSRRDPSEWSSALVWVDTERGVSARHVVGPRDGDYTRPPESHGVRALTLGADGAVWAVLGSGCAGTLTETRWCVLRVEGTTGAARAVTSLGVIGRAGSVAGVMSPFERGVAACVTSTFRAMLNHPGADEFELSSVDCARIALDGDAARLAFAEVEPRHATEGLVFHVRGATANGGDLAALRRIGVDDPERSDAVAGIAYERRYFLEEAIAPARPARLTLLDIGEHVTHLTHLPDGRLRVLAQTTPRPDHAVTVVDLSTDRRTLSRTVLPPLLDRAGRDVLQGTVVAVAPTTRGATLAALAYGQGAGDSLAVVEVDARASARLLLVTPVFQGAAADGSLGVVLAESPRSVVVAQSAAVRRAPDEAPLDRALVSWIAR
jgi:hypothetical protein